VTGADLALLARTAVHLQPSQAAHRARLRAQRTALHRWPQLGRRLLAGPDPCDAVGWPAGFTPLDADGPQDVSWPLDLAGLAELLPGRITLLGTTRTLGDPPDWQHAGAPQLWRFHLHYWDWAWALAASPDRAAARSVFARLWRSWRSSVTFGRGDAWRPYPAALRAWSWCGLHAELVAGSDLEASFAAELATHAGFLRRHLETDVGGNHLIKDLKALAGLAVFFADDRLLRRVHGQLTRQLAVQVLPDGGHYERAPAYHCQVLADLIDIDGLVRAADGPVAPDLAPAIDRMRGWLECVITPDGEVPLLNDGYPVGSAMLAALRSVAPASGPLAVAAPVADRPPVAGRVSVAVAPAGPLVKLPDTGLIVATAGGWQLLADVGAPCPDELPAHAHADTLSCLVHVDGEPLLVDTGTSTYAPGATRSYERSTAAHNTVEVDGADSTEVWGAFRAARRARVRGVAAHSEPDGVTIEAAHDGFSRLGGQPIHRRRWWLSADGLRVDDMVTGSGRHAVAVRWHLAPRSTVRPGGALDATVMTPGGAFDVTITAPARATLTVETRPVATGFERRADAPVLVCRTTGVLPIRISTVLRRADDDDAPEVRFT
jgi:uncharacterized heparinase superfamily protein